MNSAIRNAIMGLCLSLSDRGIMRDASFEKMGVLIHESLSEDNLNNCKAQNEQDIYNELYILLKNLFRKQAGTYPSLNVGAVCGRIFRRFLLLKNQI